MGFRVLCVQVIIFYVILIQYSDEVKFKRTIQGTGLPYYQMLLSLGYCKEYIIFKEQKSWHAVKLNRIIDIYYKSSNENIKVSRVEVTLIMNNTNCLGFSDTGVDHHEFTASILFSTNMAVMFYALVIYTCDEYVTPRITSSEEDPQLPFYVKVMDENIQQKE